MVVKREEGYTLIEMMIVMAIIGILAAITLPQISAFRVNAYNAVAKHDLRNAFTAAQVFFMENPEGVVTEAIITQQGFKRSDGVNELDITDGTQDGLSISVSHSRPGSTTYTINAAGRISP